MDSVQHLLQFIKSVQRDVRIKPTHVSLYLAVFHYWVLNDCSNPIHISRRKIMDLAKIRSIATYHKTISELNAFKFIHYVPSYDPRYGSAISLLIHSD